MHFSSDFFKRFIPHFIAFVVILLLFVSFVRIYSREGHRELREAVEEHSRLLADPLWNYDTSMVTTILSTLIVRKDYRAIRIYYEGKLINEVVAKDTGGAGGILHRLNFIPIRTVSGEITKEEDVVGWIEVDWLDTTSYVIAYAFLVAALCNIIVLMYIRILRNNTELEKNVVELHDAVREIRQQRDYIERIFHIVPQGLITLDAEKRVTVSNESFQRMIDKWAEVLGEERNHLSEQFVGRLLEEMQNTDRGEYAMIMGQHAINLQFAAVRLHDQQKSGMVVSLEDISEVVTLQRRLGQAEKLEAVGRLAAGIAHEINTPTQYVITNIEFLSEALEDLKLIMEQLEEVFAANDDTNRAELLADTKDSFKGLDWEFMAAEIPDAIRQSQEGLRRIQSIVQAMKHFAHPSNEQAEMCNINKAIQVTATVATNEWKYVAELDLKLDPDVPEVPCYLDQLNQVILIILVNAAHAVEERFGSDSKKGRIIIETSFSEQSVAVVISDNGCGMSEELCSKVFDPFFTTKEVGKGTGQGLAIAHDIITKLHQGTIEVSSIEGQGTSFMIRLPQLLESSTGSR